MSNPEWTIIATIVARQEKRQEVLSVLTEMLAPTRAEPGNLEYHLHCDREDECVFVFYERFRSRSDFEAHLAQPYLQPIGRRSAELLAAPIEVRRLERLSDGSGS